MHYTALQYTTMHSNALQCTAMHCTTMHCNALQSTALLPSIYSWEELTLGLSIWTEKSEVGGTKVEEEEGTVLVVWSQTIPLDKIGNVIKIEYVQYGAF